MSICHLRFSTGELLLHLPMRYKIKTNIRKWGIVLMKMITISVSLLMRRGNTPSQTSFGTV